MVLEQTIIAENVDFETYLREYAGQHAEWVGGKVFIVAPATRMHNDIVGFLIVLLRHFCEQTDSGTVLHETFTMRLASVDSAREPDVMVVTKASADRLQTTYVDGPADLVIEVVSAESTGRDRGKKFEEYEAGGVTEYWIVDPLRVETQFYVWGDDGHFHQRLPDANGFYQSAVLPRLRIEAASLVRSPLPSVADAITLVEQMLA